MTEDHYISKKEIYLLDKQLGISGIDHWYNGIMLQSNNIGESSIGEKVREFRNRADLSQFELETIIEAATGTISRIETDQVNPTKETLLRIASALDLSGLETASLFSLDHIILNQNSNVIDLKKVLERITSKWVSLLNVSYAVVLLWNADEQSLSVGSITIPQTVQNLSEKALGDAIGSFKLFKKDPSHLENDYFKCFTSNQTLITESLYDVSRPFVAEAPAKIIQSLLGMRKAISVPLAFEDNKLGVLGLIWQKEELSNQDKQMIETFAEQVSTTIYNSKLVEKTYIA